MHLVRTGRVAAVLTALVGSTLIAPTTQAVADAAVRPLNSYLVITGAGWGHGRGMSQYGAYGAADAGLNHKQILQFYYPKTSLGSLTSGNTIRVWISSDDDAKLQVTPAAGLRVRDSAGTSCALPTSSGYKRWRISRSGSKRVLHYLNAKGVWVKRTLKLSATRVWTFDNPTKGYVTVVLPGGSTRQLRQRVALRFYGSSARTVNTLTMENYLRGVVPSEMPTSWPAQAVRAQAVAARSYAARFQLAPRTSVYDLCDTAACQVYRGRGAETSGGNAAVAATANKVVKYGNSIALTMFSSSNGGHSADGGLPYLVAKADPYDGRMRNQAWSRFVSAASVQKQYPTIGSLVSVTVTRRDGEGGWGGRAEAVLITGSKGSLTVSGGAFKDAFGLRERLFAVFSGLKPGTANSDRWQGDEGGTTGRLGAPTANEVAVRGGLAARFAKGDLYWSKATKSRLLTGRVAAAFRGAGGPAGPLGFPIADGHTSGTSTVAAFENGRISCPSSGDCVVTLDE